MSTELLKQESYTELYVTLLINTLKAACLYRAANKIKVTEVEVCHGNAELTEILKHRKLKGISHYNKAASLHGIIQSLCKRTYLCSIVDCSENICK